MRRDLLIGVLLVAVGAAGATWQIEGPASASTRPLLVCPLGAHGLEPPPVWRRRLEAPARGQSSSSPGTVSSMKSV